MKKSLVNRSLQIASVVVVYAAISVWSSTSHVDMVANAITSLNSLLVILAIAVGLCRMSYALVYSDHCGRKPRRS